MTRRRDHRGFAFVALSTMLFLFSLQAYSQSPGENRRVKSGNFTILDENNLGIPEYLRHGKQAERPISVVLPSSENYSSGNDGKRNFLRIGGAFLMLAGTGAAVVNTLRAEEEFDRYSRSAFTENTDRYRTNIRRYEVYRGIGVGLAGAGFLTFTISFTL